jgi:hypothetical protein
VQSYTVKSARHSPFGERDEIEIFGCSSATIVATIVGREAGVSLKNIVGDCAGVFSASVAVGAAKVAVAVGAWVALGRLVGVSVGVGTRVHPATRTKSKKLKHTVSFFILSLLSL